MIPKSCRLFGQDHATKQVIGAKWRFDLISFRTNGTLLQGSEDVAPRSLPRLMHSPVACRNQRQRCIACRCSDSGGSSANSMRTPFWSTTLDKMALVPLTFVSP